MTVSSICKNCGLCCDGTLFNHAELDNNSVFKKHLEKKGHVFYLKENDLEERFAHPCPFFAGECTIYLDRPAICQKFLCTGIKKWKKGELRTEEIMATIYEIKRVKDELLTIASTIPKFKEYSISELRKECQPIIKKGIQSYPHLVLKIGLLIKVNLKLHVPKALRKNKSCLR